ncbi:hypothetical protein FH972_019187 [Carpinus fangiana]|uniref:DNA polymerase epsilon catalytic subunit n=1 Tax=Carpinus fangiana TaxID=176857 RepID=A0A5N6RPI1_9ROSI|nr:hypothetical protein FH972_019187 [Carpinus fangiana]
MGNEARARVVGVEAILALTIFDPPKLRSLFLHRCSERSPLSSFHRSNSSDSTYTSRPPHHTASEQHLLSVTRKYNFPCFQLYSAETVGSAARVRQVAVVARHYGRCYYTWSSPRLGSGFGGPVDLAAILDFVDSGHDLIIVADSNASDLIREIATESGVDFDEEVGFQCDKNQGECRTKFACHLDCFDWVKRDSYLPQGSQGLKGNLGKIAKVVTTHGKVSTLRLTKHILRQEAEATAKIGMTIHALRRTTWLCVNFFIFLCNYVVPPLKKYIDFL